MACYDDTCGDECYEARSSFGEDLVQEYIAGQESLAERAANRAAVVRTRIAALESELVCLDGLAGMLGNPDPKETA